VADPGPDPDCDDQVAIHPLEILARRGAHQPTEEVGYLFGSVGT
jgi:hypothetical protein